MMIFVLIVLWLMFRPRYPFYHRPMWINPFLFNYRRPMYGPRPPRGPMGGPMGFPMGGPRGPHGPRF
ncbi:MAG: hypothetical protein IK151_06995 [Erysipelotrichaceae bacterium]|nr:hypothetical protein [Erysipelotrichaceae bacterium]